MSLSTFEVRLNPDDNWVLVAVNPAIFIARARTYVPFDLAVLATAGNPDEDDAVLFSCYSQRDGHEVRIDPAPNGYYYIRVLHNPAAGEKHQVGLLYREAVLSITVDSTVITVDSTIVTCDAA